MGQDNSHPRRAGKPLSRTRQSNGDRLQNPPTRRGPILEPVPFSFPLRRAPQPPTKGGVKTTALLSTAFGPCLLALALAAGTSAGLASPLTATAAVQTRPEPGAPIITYLKAGAEPAAPSGSNALPTPPGWTAVALPGPFEGYVLNKDFTKGLDVKTGSSVYLAPKDGAGVLAVTAAGDKSEITGLFGKWTQVSLKKDLVGYIETNPTPEAVPAPLAPAPVPATAAAPVAGTAAAGGSDGPALARTFEGRFVSTHHAFVPRKPYDWQLVDESGTRLAYLDISKLMFTDQVAKYTDRPVVVYGAVHPAADGENIVVAVESLQLK
jgi:hypothetical protein